MTGVYKIVFPSGKWYVGSSKNVSERIQTHERALFKSKHKNRKLQKEYDEYSDRVQYHIIKVCDEYDMVMEEQRILDEFHGTDMCLNVSRHAVGTNIRSVDGEIINIRTGLTKEETIGIQSPVEIKPFITISDWVSCNDPCELRKMLFSVCNSRDHFKKKASQNRLVTGSIDRRNAIRYVKLCDKIGDSDTNNWRTLNELVTDYKTGDYQMLKRMKPAIKKIVSMATL